MSRLFRAGGERSKVCLPDMFSWIVKESERSIVTGRCTLEVEGSVSPHKAKSILAGLNSAEFGINITLFW
jgi:hypothetical protein